MAIMTHRTTFALDERTVTRIRALAEQWQVSQAEVIRRVVAQAEPQPVSDPRALLSALHDANEGLNATAATAYLATVRDDRLDWRRT